MKKKKDKATFCSGISGLQVPVPKYKFPEEFQNSSRLIYYATFFNSIEINSSFYKIPQALTVAKWTASVPGNFKFTFKLWEGITHVKQFEFKEEDVIKFIKAIHPAAQKKGCILIQLPPSFGKEYLAQLERLLIVVTGMNTDKWNIAVEFRNKSWYTEVTYKMLQFFNASLVIQDIPKSATPIIDHKSKFIYIRFHGPTGNYRDAYTDDYLLEYSGYIKEWMKEENDVYAYFNNTIGDAWNNLITLNKYVQQKEMA